MDQPSGTAWLSDSPAVARYARHVNPAFVRLLGVYGYGRLFVRARDVWVWDSTERQYLDFLAGFGAVNIGHNHPRLRQCLHAFLDTEALNLCHVGPSAHAADLAEKLAGLAGPLQVCLFSSSGAEAVEAGLKLARAATGRAGFLYCRGGFHGTNLGSLSVMGPTRLRRPFEPLLAGCTAIPFGDLDRLRQELAGKRYAAFLVEPILGEGGVVLPPPGYLAEACDLCRRHGTLLVLDEVQTGLGRTGRLFACQGEGITPDVLVLGKSLGGSLAAISATLTTAELHHRAYGSMGRFDLHSSTFGGNALACAAALETLNIIEDEGLTARSRERGGQLLASLQKRLAGHPLVRQVRGAGLLVGVELGPTDDLLGRVAPWLVEQVARGVLGQWLALRLLEAGVIVQPASQCWNVLRLEPPLTVQPAQVEQVVETLGNILDEYRGLGRLLQDVGARLGRQMLAGWRF